MQLAVAQGDLDWLLHCDADELFHPGHHHANICCDATAHFAELTRRRVATFCYANHEAVPERHDVDNPFREVTLFKRSLDAIEPTAPGAREALQYWEERADGCFFHYYDNGKAAVRVHQNAKPLSVHEFLPGDEEGTLHHWHSNLKEVWQSRGELARVVKYTPSIDASILHYPCCSVEALYARWRRGNDNYRLASVETPPPLHEHVSNVADAAMARGGERAAREAIRECFEQRVMVQEERVVERQLDARVCLRVDAVARVLSQGMRVELHRLR